MWKRHSIRELSVHYGEAMHAIIPLSLQSGLHKRRGEVVCPLIYPIHPLPSLGLADSCDLPNTAMQFDLAIYKDVYMR